MKNPFQQVMSKRMNEELIKIVTVDKIKYEPNAVSAAEAEIEKRNIDPLLFEKVTEKVQEQKQQSEREKLNVAGSSIRFINFIVDIIAFSVLIYITTSLVGSLVNPLTEKMATLLSYATSGTTFFAYYAIMETKFQKTIGKFLTQTSVVTLDGQKPTDADIIARTICRFLPFDRLSFLLIKNGIHDYLSKTTVIKDSAN